MISKEYFDNIAKDRNKIRKGLFLRENPRKVAGSRRRKTGELAADMVLELLHN